MYAAILTYILGLMAFSWWVSRRETREEFLIAGRNRPAWQIMLSKFASTIGAGWFLTYTSMSFKFGASMFIGLIGYFSMMILFALWAAPRIFDWGREVRATTLSELISMRLKNNMLGRFVGIFAALAQSSWIVVSVVGGAKVMELVGVSGGYIGGVFMVSVFTYLYIVLAGMKGVILTDVLQGIILMVLLGVVGIAMAMQPQALTALQQVNEPIDALTTVGLTLVGLNFFAYLERYQLCFAAQSKQAAQRGMLWPLLPIVVMAGILVLLGQYAKLIDPLMDPDMAFVRVIQTALSPAFLPVVVVLFMVAIMSSMDTNFYAAASHLVTGEDEQGYQRRIRLMLAVLMAFSIALALMMKSVVSLSFFALGFSGVPAVAMIYVIAGGTRTGPFVMSFALAAGFFVLGAVLLGIVPEWLVGVYVMGLMGLGVGFIPLLNRRITGWVSGLTP